jgi:hypothetical protein
MNTKKYLYLLLFFILSGCVSEKGYWYKDGLTQDELAKVRYICLQQARQYNNYNVYRSNKSNAFSDALNKQADSIRPMNKNQAGSQAFIRGFAAGFGNDNYEDNREYELYSACMNAYGIYWKVEK